ncbi:MAG: MFS transporter [Anaerolineales bacterium]
MILGVMRPMLSRLAYSMGASLTLIGVLGLVLGLSRTGTSILMGAVSDRLGRKIVLVIGICLLGVSSIGTGLSKTTSSLIIMQIILGLAFTASLNTGVVCIADIMPTEKRGLAFGIGSTVLGAGFSLGSFLGGMMTQYWGYQAVYIGTGVFAVLGIVLAYMYVDNSSARNEMAILPLLKHAKSIILNKPILILSIGGALSFMVFGGLVVMFFPIYAMSIGMDHSTIGIMFAVRTAASTLVRFPGGIFSKGVVGQWLLPISLIGTAVFALITPQLQSPALMMVFLVIEGISYGLYYTIGQLFAVNLSADVSRGLVLGSYATFSGIGGGILPFFMGIIADAVTIERMFQLTSIPVFIGAAVMIWRLVKANRSTTMDLV